MKQYKAAVFDMDGVIIDSGPTHLKAWENTFKEYNLSFDVDKFRYIYGMRDSEVIPKLIGIMSDEESHALAARKSKIFLELIRTSGKITSGLKEFVDYLYQKDITTALASLAASEEINTILEISGLNDRLKVVITKDQLMRDKPAPDIFLTAAYRLGVKPLEVVVFEDAINGVEAARSAGVTTVAITTSFSRGELSHADLVIDDFFDPALFKLI